VEQQATATADRQAALDYAAQQNDPGQLDTVELTPEAASQLAAA
jgi:hypothetical protein